ncbi:hypothetical protein [Methanothermobacter sp. THM-2]|uniref:hypothetical protein n=1 Tax=Methanothermobacter sp. THM-2 TaxID=2606912 RepID=UPI00136635A9|nr:hypothetical protein [Methanothermobacter sp. THM-2]QHN08732.1 hypothetical protein FZP68_08410 [Methanothermobacter sp. THM-2]
MVFDLPGSLYEEAALRRDEIRGYLRSRMEELPDASEYWFSHDGEDDSLATAACDRASGFREFSGLRLVAVNTAMISKSDDLVSTLNEIQSIISGGLHPVHDRLDRWLRTVHGALS